MKRIGLFLALSVALVGCVPASNLALGAVNAVGRADDGTSLLVTTEGIVFQPVGLKERVVLSVVADEVVNPIDERCVEIETARIVCKLGNLNENTLVVIKGVNRDALISWLQDGELAARFIVAKE